MNETPIFSEEQKDAILQAVVVDGEIDYFPTSNPMFVQLQSEELRYAFHLFAEHFAEGNFSVTGEVKKQEYYDYFFALSLGMNELAQELYAKPYNHLTNEEFANLLDDEYREVAKRAVRYTKTSVAQKKFEEIALDSQIGASTSQKYVRAASSCSGYVYKIKTTIASSGSRDCISYNSATNLGDDDCDYEFTFNWGKSYTPSTLALAGTSTEVRLLLQKGGINGRLHANRSGTPPNLVSFLIGAGRIRLVYPWIGPEGVKTNLKGSW